VTSLLAHIAGLPVEEVLLGVLALGAAGIRMATVYVRRRRSWGDVRIAQSNRVNEPGFRQPPRFSQIGG
jgi:hypothetical protein